jgi:hypothetical protein
MSAGIKVIYHTQKVSHWHNDLWQRSNFFVFRENLMNTITNLAFGLGYLDIMLEIAL